VFEGLVRKLLPAIGLLVFFLKDFMCILGLYFIMKLSDRNTPNNALAGARKFFAVAFIPLLINTLFIDPVLVVFSMKQYLLYIVLGLLVPAGFPPDKFDKFKVFIAVISLLIIPTTLIAMLQNVLPPSHWLNLSVGGESLEAFSAAGFLRVSSTFSFTGQYTWFLNMVTGALLVSFFIPVNKNYKHYKTIKKLYPVLAAGLIIGVFITGGRTAVLGSAVVLVIGFVLATIKSPQRFLARGIGIGVVFFIGLTLLKVALPQFFAAYDRRSQTAEGASNSGEVGNRVLHDVFGWTEIIEDLDAIPFLFGQGMGVMSNGVEKISGYAASIRAYYWTESDLATTVWEGGAYFFLLWYGFRLWVIINCLKMWRKVNDHTIGLALSFLLGYIMLIGLYGTLSTQGPMAIWWWMSIGIFTTIYNYDRYNAILSRVQNEK
jgi:hypothetical protein